jgi:gliotoxin/aspirochlorine biosynthesis glutathione S-transferase
MKKNATKIGNRSYWSILSKVLSAPLKPSGTSPLTQSADDTSYINYIKPLILVEELRVPYTIELVNTKADWYGKVHPERYVPALRDFDGQIGRDIFVFESTACLQYLAERYDAGGDWKGRTSWERAQVLSWTAYFTAGLG